MIESLNLLIEALRDELKNYGEMLALLDRQQEFLITRAADEFTQSIALAREQGTIIEQARNRREECFRVVAEKAGRPGTTAFVELIPLLPVQYQPLVKALTDENNELLFRVRLRARQNHLILKRSVHLMNQVMSSLNRPNAPTPAHRNGKVKGAELVCHKSRSRLKVTRRLYGKVTDPATL